MKRLSLIGAILLVCALMIVSQLAPHPSNAAPSLQSYPTATLLNTDDLEYTITEVTAKDEALIIPDQTVGDVTISAWQYRSLYPSGLEFIFTATSPQNIVSLSLVYEFGGGSRGRVDATPTEVENQWRAVPYDRGGLPPWQAMDIILRINLEESGVIETVPFEVEYYDPTRTWFRAESQDAIVYWFDFPRELGDIVMHGIAAVRDRYEKGFGGILSYRPRVIIFPPGDAIGEFETGGGTGNPRTTGSASDSTQSAILRVRGLEIEEIRQNCIWNEPRDVNWQMRFAASVATHEIAHLYQYEFFNGQGPAWWIEGQATFFELDMGFVDERMRNLARFQDLPTLQGQGPSGMVGTPATDGCTHLGYEMGASFINWLVNSYGGFDTHRQIVELMDRNVSLGDALEQVTGVPFLELEKQWRVYVGLRAEPKIIPTPTFPTFPTVAPYIPPTKASN